MRIRADVAGYRSVPKQIGSTADFFRMQTCAVRFCDGTTVSRDSCTLKRLQARVNRRQVLETRLRTHYTTCTMVIRFLPEFDSYNFSVIGHRGYAQLVSELRTLQNRLYDCTNFEKLIRYRCANSISSC